MQRSNSFPIRMVFQYHAVSASSVSVLSPVSVFRLIPGASELTLDHPASVNPVPRWWASGFPPVHTPAISPERRQSLDHRSYGFAVRPISPSLSAPIPNTLSAWLPLRPAAQIRTPRLRRPSPPSRLFFLPDV